MTAGTDRGVCGYGTRLPRRRICIFRNKLLHSDLATDYSYMQWSLGKQSIQVAPEHILAGYCHNRLDSAWVPQRSDDKLDASAFCERKDGDGSSRASQIIAPVAEPPEGCDCDPQLCDAAESATTPTL